jgi:hypothetical protein
MPSQLSNVHSSGRRSGQCDHAKTGDFASTARSTRYSPAIFARCATSASTASSAGVGSWVNRPISWTTVTSGSISIGRPRSRSCSIEVLWAPTLARAVDPRLQADDHEILPPEFGGVVGAVRTHQMLFAADQQFQSALAHGGKMGGARDQADLGAGARKLHAEIAADRAGAVDADFHESFRWSFARRSPAGFEHLKAR